MDAPHFRPCAASKIFLENQDWAFQGGDVVSKIVLLDQLRPISEFDPY